MTGMTRAEAQHGEAVAAAFRQHLEQWRESYEQRDPLIRAAYTAGVNRQQIHTLTGLARTTIDGILGEGLPMSPPISPPEAAAATLSKPGREGRTRQGSTADDSQAGCRPRRGES